MKYYILSLFEAKIINCSIKKSYLLYVLNVFIFSIFYHSVLAQSEHNLYLYSSSDGTNFGAPLLLVDSADVPSLLQDSSGRLICVFQNFKGGFGSSTWDKLGVITSIDNGNTWSDIDIISVNGLPGTVQRVFDPTIVLTSDFRYRLFFSYCPNTMMLDSTCDTYSAISTDFINYSLESGTRFNELNERVIDPTVVYYDSFWHYTAPLSVPPPTPLIGGARHAISSDGLNFSLIDSVGVGDLNHNWTGNLMDDGTSMRFYGFTNNVLGDYIWWSSSVDGTNWSNYNLTNIKGKDPAVYKTSLTYWMIVPQVPSNVAVNNVKTKQKKVVVYPNPTNNSTTFHLKNMNELWSLTLMDGTGKVVENIEKISNVKYIFNVNNLSPSVYFYKVMTQTGDCFYGRLEVLN